MQTPKWVIDVKPWCRQCHEEASNATDRCPTCGGELVEKNVRVPVETD